MRSKRNANRGLVAEWIAVFFKSQKKGLFVLTIEKKSYELFINLFYGGV